MSVDVWGLGNGHCDWQGIFKREPLRRINRERRLVYRVAGSGKDQTLQMAPCQYHC